MRGLRIALALAVPTTRAARWGPFLGAAGVGVALVAVPSALPVTLSPDNLTVLLRLAVVCAGVGAVFLVDDPAKPSTVTSPVPSWITILIRAAGALLAAAAWWAVAVAVTLAGAEGGTGEGIRLPGSTIEAATTVAVALALSVFGWRASDRGVGSTVAAPALLGVVTTTALLPADVALLVSVEHPGWTAVHGRWVAVLALALIAIPAGAAWRRPVRRHASASG